MKDWIVFNQQELAGVKVEFFERCGGVWKYKICDRSMAKKEPEHCVGFYFKYDKFATTLWKTERFNRLVFLTVVLVD